MPSAVVIVRSRTAVGALMLIASSSSMAIDAGSTCICAAVGSANDVNECDKALEYGCTKALEGWLCATTAW